MKTKVIACAIFRPYIEYYDLCTSDIIYLDIHQHNQPKKLARMIQKEIDETSGYDAILLLYGLCGGMLREIHANEIPVTLIRAHDCLPLLVGYKKTYRDLMKQNPSLSYSCYALKKSGFTNDSWAQEYDEETVEYLRSILCRESEIYIDLGLEDEYREKHVLKGTIQLLKNILNGTAEELLTLHKGQRVKLSPDENVMEITEE